MTDFPAPVIPTDNGMRHIRLFQVFDLFLGQFNGQSADGIFRFAIPASTMSVIRQ
jgi:hypothetical protein